MVSSKKIYQRIWTSQPCLLYIKRGWWPGEWRGIMDLWVRVKPDFLNTAQVVGTNFQPAWRRWKLQLRRIFFRPHELLKIGDRCCRCYQIWWYNQGRLKWFVWILDHPEIVDFINWKVERRKGRRSHRCRIPGYEDKHIKINEPDKLLTTLSAFRTHSSGKLEKRDWELKRKNGRPGDEMPARELWNQFTEAAWRCADPQFNTNQRAAPAPKAVRSTPAASTCSSITLPAILHHSTWWSFYATPTLLM